MKQECDIWSWIKEASSFSSIKAGINSWCWETTVKSSSDKLKGQILISCSSTNIPIEQNMERDKEVIMLNK